MIRSNWERPHEGIKSCLILLIAERNSDHSGRQRPAIRLSMPEIETF